MSFKEKLIRFMAGRYGRDQLNSFISVLIIVILFVDVFARKRMFFYFAILLLVILYYRMFSRDYAKRAAENQKFLQVKSRLFGGFNKKRTQALDKEHAYFKCPNCKKTLRVPKGKGQIQIRCPKCGKEFVKRT